MPMPTPNPDESKDKFIDRCMGADVMVSDFPDEKQRFAVCNSQWDKKSKKNKTFMETRAYPFEIREVEYEAPKIAGYAAVYEQLSDDLGGFREKIRRGFFTEAIGRDDVRALFNHDDNYVLGRTTNGTLILSEDRNGLKVEINPPDTTYARDLMNLIRRGDVNQMSFQFVVEEDAWDSTDLNNVVRTLTKIKSLWDVSPVTFPAYPQTKAGIRSAREVFINYLENYLEELEDHNSGEQNIEAWSSRLSVLRKRLAIVEKEI